MMALTGHEADDPLALGLSDNMVTMYQKVTNLCVTYRLVIFWYMRHHIVTTSSYGMNVYYKLAGSY